MSRRLAISFGSATAALALAAVAAAAGGARLAGSFQASLTITALQWPHSTLRVGDRAVRTWTFTPACGAGACTTTLRRPSIAPGSKNVYVYSLEPVGTATYRGLAGPVPNGDLCDIYSASGQVTAQYHGAYVRKESITLHVTKVAGGRVAAFSGTDVVTETPTSLGRAHGCPASTQTASFSAPA